MAEIRIGGAGRETLLVDVIARERPQATDSEDGNWLQAVVQVHVGGFDGRTAGALRAEEFVIFRDELAALHHSLRGTATLRTIEGWLTIQMAGDGRGHVELAGQLHDRPGSENRLVFHLDVDQTHLPHVLAGLDDVVTRFRARRSD